MYVCMYVYIDPKYRSHDQLRLINYAIVAIVNVPIIEAHAYP